MFYRNNGNDKEESKDIRKVLAGIAILAFAMLIFGIPELFQSVSETTMDNIELVVYLLIYLLTAYDVAVGSITNLFNGKIETERILITAASLGAFFVGTYWEACLIMFVFMMCECLKERISIKNIEQQAMVRGINIVKLFTDIVVVFAFVVAVVPSMTDVLAYGADIKNFEDVWREWIYRAFTCLAVACPCTLVISENFSLEKSKQNLVIALVIKCILLLLAALGIGTIGLTALVEAALCGIVFMNTKRTMQ